VLVEGGATTHAAFLDAGLADRLALFLAPELLGARGAVPLVAREVAARPGAGWRVADLRHVALGEDLALFGRLVAPAGRG
jgi:diaminohydroxyphosphoribosylaminopyrimidine deaminase/5-amino-6-(5-phosphoribosylamino)uracil reductase